MSNSKNHKGSSHKSSKKQITKQNTSKRASRAPLVNPTLLSVIWYVKVVLIMVLVACLILCFIDLINFAKSQDSKGKKHKIFTILTFVIEFFFILFIIIMVIFFELCGLICVSCCRIVIMIYQVWTNSVYISTLSFIANSISLLIIVAFSILLCWAK